MPIHHLCCDLFEYSLEDLCRINDFRVKIIQSHSLLKRSRFYSV